MSMQFRRAVEDMEIWSANSDGFSFVISYETSAGHGFHGHPGYVASWRPLDERRGAIKIGGSPFKTFADAEEACTPPGCHMIRLTETREITRGAASGFSVAMRERLIRNPSPFHSFA